MTLLLFQIICAFGLYIWCAAADPADPGVFKSKKYINIPEHKKHDRLHESKLGGDSTSSIHDANAATVGVKPLNKDMKDMDTATEDRATEIEEIGTASQQSFCFKVLLALLTPCAYVRNCSNSHDESSGQQASEDGMFYCSLCEVEVCMMSHSLSLFFKMFYGFEAIIDTRLLNSFFHRGI